VLSHLQLPGAGKLSRREGCGAFPEPAGRQAARGVLRQLAVSSSILRRESKLLSHPSSLFPICSLTGFPSQPLSALAPAHVIHFSRAFLGFGSPSEALQAGMKFLTIPRCPRNPTLSATQDFHVFRSLAALHKLSGSVCHLHTQDKAQGCPLRPPHLLMCQVEPS